jgi:uncharacterized protein (TIGR00255 family)
LGFLFLKKKYFSYYLIEIRTIIFLWYNKSYLANKIFSMLNSMTGFGRAEVMHGEKTFLVEVKSLNGKQFELQLKMPSILKPFEFEIRNILQENLLRGTIECSVQIKQNGLAKPLAINTELVKAYYAQIKSIATELEIDTNSILSSILKMPEIVSTSTEILTDEDYAIFKKVLQEALTHLKNHRAGEGKSIQNDLLQRIENIKNEEEKILAFVPNRSQKIKDEIHALLEKHVGAEKIDSNRMEQELIYYMEKIDIHEEQIRLRQHCIYFNEILQNDEEGKGKKLSFVLQEIGREINTTGSKAYDADIQKCVVTMKDELEKAKEQILNVL